jgi:hypothetical protein
LIVVAKTLRSRNRKTTPTAISSMEDPNIGTDHFPGKAVPTCS